MIKKHNKELKPLAKNLRKNMTREERHLWYDFLKNYPIRIDRQKILGKYIVDFYCASVKIIIELDGSQHYFEDGEKYDRERTDYLQKNFGVTVIRISNLDVMKNFTGVCDYIDYKIKERIEK
ncbi:MAG: endonuclease domain-containing protein [Clostridia bacterium]|nr:endonuclease domain-containing protein [Clostridia bacterium]